MCCVTTQAPRTKPKPHKICLAVPTMGPDHLFYPLIFSQERPLWVLVLLLSLPPREGEKKLSSLIRDL